MTTISIIIVTYNSEFEISDCIDSLLSQIDDINGEIIVIDNNSNDETVKILESYKSLRIISNKENLGYTKANNQGVKQAQGKYILLLNPDTIIPNGVIQKLINEINSEDNLGAIAPQLRFPDGTIQYSCRRFPRRRDVLYQSLLLDKLFKNLKEFNYWKMIDFNHNTNHFVDQPAGAAILIPKKVFNDIGYLDEQFPMFFSDVDMCKRIWNAGYKIKFTPNISLTHFGGASIYRNRNKMIVSTHRSFWKYLKKHYTNNFDKIYNFITGILLLIGIPIRIFLNILFLFKKSRNSDIL